jgi:hypothetical protein
MPWNHFHTALLFPTGGYHWPGMGADIDATPRREIFDRAEAALAPFGVAPGSLRRLMAGHDQARRVRGDGGWCWSGDFPLSMVAQMALADASPRPSHTTGWRFGQGQAGPEPGGGRVRYGVRRLRENRRDPL